MLGSTYLKLIRELSINVPIVDPVIYITRFAALLDFGEETQKVALDATRLVNRMGRDWMQIGRRPSGICGACLLLAARMNNFRRSIEEIVQVVKIADVTLRKRLAEFQETASGALTVADFRSIWLEETQDPPAYTQGIKREEDARKKRDRAAREGTAMSDASETSTAFGDRAFRELADREATAEAEDGEPRGPPAEGKENEAEREGDMPPPPRPSAKALGKRKRVEPDLEAGEGPGEDEAEQDVAEELLEGDAREQYEAVMRDEMSTYLDSTTGAKLMHELDSQQAHRLKVSQSPAVELNTDDRLDNLDEDELDAFILTDAEVEIKSRLWMENNKEYLRELAEKQTGPDGELKPLSKRPVRSFPPSFRRTPLTSTSLQRKRTKPRDGANATGLTAADATTKMLEKKKFSKKINYDAIRNLFNASGSDAGSTYGGAASSVRGGADGEEDDDEPFIGQRYGSRAGSRVGTPLVLPEPTWRQSSRAPSEAPSVVSEGPSKKRAQAQDDDEDEEAWRSQFATQQEDDGYDGYDEV